MIIDIGIYQLDIDVDRTVDYYRKEAGILCDCNGCQNYKNAAVALPQPVLGFFQLFGIDPAKPAEVCVYHAPSMDTVHYGGFYYACGTILKGTKPWIQAADKHFRLDEAYRINLSDGFSLYIIQPRLGILGEDFPGPVVQIEIDFTMPWVLDKPNPYIS